MSIWPTFVSLQEVRMTQNMLNFQWTWILILYAHTHEKKIHRTCTVKTKAYQIAEAFSQCIITVIISSKSCVEFFICPYPHLYHKLAWKWMNGAKLCAIFFSTFFCVIIFNFIGKLTAYYKYTAWGWKSDRLLFFQSLFLLSPFFSSTFSNMYGIRQKYISMVVNHWIFLPKSVFYKVKNRFLLFYHFRRMKAEERESKKKILNANRWKMKRSENCEPDTKWK